MVKADSPTDKKRPSNRKPLLQSQGLLNKGIMLGHQDDLAYEAGDGNTSGRKWC